MLTVDRIQTRTKVLGPGVRAVVWFHGCSRNCPGCVAAEMNRSTEFESVSADELVERVCVDGGIEGVTISGGEPFEQDLDSLCRFLEGLKRQRDLGVMVYTGYRLEELKRDPMKDRALSLVDLLVDGPYVESEDHGELWRGSANQQFHFLTSRYAGLKDDLTSQIGRPLEFSFKKGLQFEFTGVPPKGFREKLERRLSARDFEVRW